MNWTQPRRVDVWWWMQIRLHDEMDNVTREGTVTWNADGTGHYGVFISFEREGIGLHCWPYFRRLSDAQEFVEQLMAGTLAKAQALHGTQWPGIVL